MSRPIEGDRINPYRMFYGAMLPNWLLRRKELNTLAKVVYARFSQYGGRQGDVFPKVATVAEELGTCERSIRRAIKELEECGLIKVIERRKERRSSIYVFLAHRWNIEESVSGWEIEIDEEALGTKDPSVLPTTSGNKDPSQAKHGKSAISDVDNLSGHSSDRTPVGCGHSVRSLRDSGLRDSLRTRIPEEKDIEEAKPLASLASPQLENLQPEQETAESESPPSPIDIRGSKREQTPRAAELLAQAYGGSPTVPQRTFAFQTPSKSTEERMGVLASIERAQERHRAERERKLDEASKRSTQQAARESYAAEMGLTIEEAPRVVSIGKLWRSKMADFFPELPLSKLGRKEYAQFKNLKKKYPEEGVVETYLTYCFDNWSAINEQFCKGAASHPHIGFLLKFHADLVGRAYDRPKDVSVPRILQGDADVLAEEWTRDMRQKYVGIPVAKLDPQDKVQLTELLDVYDRDTVQVGLRFVIECWELIRARYFKGKGGPVPTVRLLRKLHSSLIPESRVWMQHAAVISEYNSYGTGEYVERPSALIAQYSEAAKALKALGFDL